MDVITTTTKNFIIERVVLRFETLRNPINTRWNEIIKELNDIRNMPKLSKSAEKREQELLEEEVNLKSELEEIESKIDVAVAGVIRRLEQTGNFDDLMKMINDVELN